MLACSILIAPLSTYAGLASLGATTTVTVRGSHSVPCLVCWAASPAVLALAALLIRHFARGGAVGFLSDFEGGAGELKAGCLWALFCAPLAACGWRAVRVAADVWGAGSSGHAARPSPQEAAYYARLVQRKDFDDAFDDKLACATDCGLAQEEEHRHPLLSSKARPRGGLSRYLAATRDELLAPVGLEEALPAFASMLCVFVLFPFGVIAPVVFLTKRRMLGVERKSVVMGFLAAVVFVSVTVVTTLANASMERIKTEQQQKLAAHALRLALRKKKVLVSPALARLACERRDAHAMGAQHALAKTTRGFATSRESPAARKSLESRRRTSLLQMSK